MQYPGPVSALSALLRFHLADLPAARRTGTLYVAGKINTATAVSSGTGVTILGGIAQSVAIDASGISKVYVSGTGEFALLNTCTSVLPWLQDLAVAVNPGREMHPNAVSPSKLANLFIVCSCLMLSWPFKWSLCNFGCGVVAATTQITGQISGISNVYYDQGVCTVSVSLVLSCAGHTCCWPE